MLHFELLGSKLSMCYTTRVFFFFLMNKIAFRNMFVNIKLIHLVKAMRTHGHLLELYVLLCKMNVSDIREGFF